MMYFTRNRTVRLADYLFDISKGILIASLLVPLFGGIHETMLFARSGMLAILSLAASLLLTDDQMI